MRDLYIKHNRWQDALDIQRRVLKAGPAASRVAEEKELLLFLRYEVARQAIADGSARRHLAEFKKQVRERGKHALQA